MRVAVVSDVHGNLTALDAVIADLKRSAPDLVVHGGDLLGGGARQAEVIDRIRDLRWPGVFGNADEMLWHPARAAEHLQAPALKRVREIVFDHIGATVEAIGDDRLDWLRALPIQWSDGGLTVVHASPDDVWRSPLADASDKELEDTFGILGSPQLVYGHIHRAYVRRLPSITVGNSGSVSLSLDGDPRAAYALIDDGEITIRRVAYDIEREVTMLFEQQYPHAAWLAESLRKATYVAPPS